MGRTPRAFRTGSSARWAPEDRLEAAPVQADIALLQGRVAILGGWRVLVKGLTVEDGSESNLLPVGA